MSDVDVLVFDLGGVIVPYDNAVLYARLAGRCTSPLPALADFIREDRTLVGAPVEELHRRLVDDFGYSGDWDAFRADFCCHLGLDTEMLELVEQLATQHRVMLFSNTNGEHWAHVVALSGGRLGKLEAWLSYELGLAKPDPEAFRAVARRAGFAPERALFIDDTAENVEAARGVGFQAIHFTGRADLVRRLTGMGLMTPRYERIT